MVEYKFEGEEQIVKTVSKFGNGGMVCVPREWGKAKVAIVLIKKGEPWK